MTVVNRQNYDSSAQEPKNIGSFSQSWNGDYGEYTTSPYKDIVIPEGAELYYVAANASAYRSRGEVYTTVTATAFLVDGSEVTLGSIAANSYSRSSNSGNIYAVAKLSNQQCLQVDYVRITITYREVISNDGQYNCRGGGTGTVYIRNSPWITE